MAWTQLTCLKDRRKTKGYQDLTAEEWAVDPAVVQQSEHVARKWYPVPSFSTCESDPLWRAGLLKILRGWRRINQTAVIRRVLQGSGYQLAESVQVRQVFGRQAFGR